MADSLTPATWWGSILGWGRRALGAPTREEEQIKAGAACGSDAGVSPEYRVEDSISAFAAFPWVRACVDAVSSDLAGVPWTVSRGKGEKAERLPEHELLALLENPTTWQTGEEWERQVWTFLLLTGNAYAVLVGPDGAPPRSLPLLHPEQTRIVSTDYGAPAAYEYNDGSARYEPSRIVHFRLASWQRAPQGLLGEGLIRALHNDLTADLAASKMAARTARRGRPDVILSPDGGLWEPDAREAIATAYDKQVARGGALVLSDAMKAEFPSFTPRDLEFQAQRQLTRETVMAAFGLVPGRLGIPDANYATQQAQNAVYWQGLVGLARLLSARLTRSVGALCGADIVIGKDFSGVEALQESRTARQERVVTWTLLGAAPAEAASYEGFHDAPVPAAGEEPDERPDDVETPDETPAPRALRLVADRDARWRSFLTDTHTPAERALATRIGRELEAQADRVAARLDLVTWPVRQARRLVTRDIASDILSVLWPSLEDEALGEASRGVLAAAIDRAFGQTEGEMAVGALEFAPSRKNALIDANMASLLKAGEFTRYSVKTVIDRGLADGWSVNEMQAQIQKAAAFGPARALRVARTETTRAVNGGASSAMSAAQAIGARVRQEWLSARDRHVRDAHLLLDGQERALGEPFVIPGGVYQGKAALYPGDFADPALVVNCRCTVIPVLEAA